MWRSWRVWAGIGVLALLAAFAVYLTPPYVANWKMQQYLNDLASDAATATLTPEAIQSKVLSEGSQLGMPLDSNDVQVARSADGLRIQVLYVVHINLPLYAVDLHFRPGV